MRHGGLKVLLAEDDPSNRHFATCALEQLDCEVTVVSDGDQAVACERRAVYDIVFLDCRMPKFDGARAAAAIRAAERRQGRPPIPLVALTASTLTLDWQRCLDAGMDLVVIKPFCIEQLKDVLQRFAA